MSMIYIYIYILYIYIYTLYIYMSYIYIYTCYKYMYIYIIYIYILNKYVKHIWNNNHKQTYGKWGKRWIRRPISKSARWFHLPDQLVLVWTIPTVAASWTTGYHRIPQVGSRQLAALPVLAPTRLFSPQGRFFSWKGRPRLVLPLSIWWFFGRKVMPSQWGVTTKSWSMEHIWGVPKMGVPPNHPFE